MKRFALLLLLVFAAVAAAATINELGTAGAPISVTTAAKVLNENGNRKGWSILADGVDIRCNVGTANNGAPTRTPTSTVGFLFKSGILYSLTLGSLDSRVDMSPTQRLDCASTAGAVGVNTWTW